MPSTTRWCWSMEPAETRRRRLDWRLAPVWIRNDGGIERMAISRSWPMWISVSMNSRIATSSCMETPIRICIGRLCWEIRPFRFPTGVFGSATKTHEGMICRRSSYDRVRRATSRRWCHRIDRNTWWPLVGTAPIVPRRRRLAGLDRAEYRCSQEWNGRNRRYRLL